MRVLTQARNSDMMMGYILKLVDFGNSLVEVDVGLEFVAWQGLGGCWKIAPWQSECGGGGVCGEAYQTCDKISCTLWKLKRQFWVLCWLEKYCYSP